MSSPITESNIQYAWDQMAVRTDNPLRKEAASPRKHEGTEDGWEAAAHALANSLGEIKFQSPEKEPRVFSFEDLNDSPDYKLKASKSKERRVVHKKSNEEEATMRRIRRDLFKK